jgi:hypothetical protein
MYYYPTRRRRAEALGYVYEGHLRGLREEFFMNLQLTSEETSAASVFKRYAAGNYSTVDRPSKMLIIPS